MVQVSVIMACFNVAEYLERSINSVIAQQDVSWDLHIVDDCSTDDTSRIARKFAAQDHRISFMELQRNGGPSRARNEALKKAKGEWVAILDADDAFQPTRLATMVDAAQHSDDMLMDNLTFWDEGARAEAGVALPVAEPRRKTLTWADLAASEAPDTKQKLGYLKPIVRRSFIEKHKLYYDEELRLAEDFEFYARALLSGAQAAIINDPLYVYTMQVGQLSGKKSGGTRTNYDPRSRVKIATKLESLFRNNISLSDLKWIERYKRWQVLYADSYDIAVSRKNGDYKNVASIALRNPQAFMRYMSEVKKRLGNRKN